jgi:hypothetical protein
MNRRAIILGISGAALAACSPTPPASAPTQSPWLTDADLITSGVVAVAPAILADPKISAADAATINNAVAQVQAADTALHQAATLTAAAPAAQEIQTALQLMAPIGIAVLGATTPAGIAITAAVALMPVLLQASGVSAPVAALASARRMSPDEARLVLRGYIGGQ